MTGTVLVANTNDFGTSPSDVQVLLQRPWLDEVAGSTFNGMETRRSKTVVVPNVIGMPFHVGRDIAFEAGVTLANPDPDGPPIGALAWPGLFYITWQHPAAGSVLHEWDSVGVEVVKHGDALSAATRNSPATPPKLSAHTRPDHDAP